MPDAFGFLEGGGELAGLIRSFDWAKTPVGPIASWPISRKITIALVLRSPIAIVTLWGPEGVMIYNDAYSKFGGGRHPGLLGSNVREAWPEVADFNDHVVTEVFHRGRTLSYADRELWLNRDGVSRQLWTNLDYSPIVDEQGRRVGVFAVVTETTERVLADRRIAAERDRQQQLFQQMPGFVCVLSGPNHVYEYVNEAYLEIAGRTGFIGNTVAQMFPELAGQGYFELLDSVYATGTAVVTRGAELRLAGHDAAQFIDFVYQPIREADGRVSGVFVGGYEVTEAHRAAALLRASETRLRELNADLERQVIERTQARGLTWKMSPDLLGALNEDGYFETSNPAWQTVLGWTEEEVRRTPFLDFLYSDDVQRTRDQFSATRHGQPAIHFPNRYRCKDGTYKWISWVAVPEDNMIYCSGREITAEKQREQALTALARERDRAWQISRELLLVAAPDGTFETVNPTWTELLGWSEPELIGAKFADIAHPDDTAATTAAFTAVRNTPMVVAHEHRLRHKDGTYRWFAWTGSFEDGRIYASGRDVTHDREREAVLRDTQDFARLALTAVGGVGVWTYEIASDLFFYDDVIADIYGIDPARGVTGILRADFLQNVVVEDLAALRSTMQGGLNSPGDLELEYRIRHPDGRIRWVLSRGHTYHDKSGAAVRRTGVGVETTNQRETEEALRQSQKMEAVGQLTGGVAHDFNNLLTVIRSSTDLLKRPNLTDARRERYVSAISDTVDRAAKLTGQLLAFARRQALRPEVFAVGDSVRAIVGMLGTLTGSRIDIVTHLPDTACWINADPSQFDTALVNMVVNARDAMDGEGCLTITVVPADSMPAVRSHEAIPGAYVAVSIADTGVGIAPAHLDKIFEPFFTTKGVGKGTGLGLSQVFGFAKQSGGEVIVASDIGVGTTFTLYLPRVAQAEPRVPPAALAVPLADGHGTRVLVVEDNHDVGAFAIQALDELGYVAVLANSAKAALAELADGADRFDVVFTDVVMPGMSGIELAEEIRRTRPSLPVVLTSGYSHVLAQNGTSGFDLLHKPYSAEELSQVLRSATARGRMLGTA